ncbi:membrane-spanning 4-domains subfamily A member 4D-like [Xyrichtys novacula]|uniref:Membrane-spanning 4-domains subfamily A member 4D-like n=1 Tax=Xyrichtys novacula TaxID=13765 RepID=A0AAV1FK31_XYRNO|nr:membrane-spanning 4-domains subfamily A member 4D-like [Xyrichtys novacula]
MTSTSVTTVGGLVVVTQVIPQSEKAIPLQAADTIQAPPPAAPAPPSQPAAPTKIDDMTATFLRAGPQSLGIVQIFIGLLCLLFSLTALFSPVLLGHAPLCLAVTFVVSGSVTVSAAKRTSRNHVSVLQNQTQGVQRFRVHLSHRAQSPGPSSEGLVSGLYLHVLTFVHEPHTLL